MAQVNLPSAPEPTGNVIADMRAMQVAYAQLTERLQFILQNLDSRNFTKAFNEQIGGSSDGDPITSD